MRVVEPLGGRRGWCIYATMMVAYMLSNFHQVGLSAISTRVGGDLGIDSAGLALLASAFAYPYAAMQIPAGLLADTWGARKSVTAATLLMAAGTALFALAETLGQALLGRMCIGLGSAVILVPLMKLTAVWFAAESFGKLLASAFTLGALGLVVATGPMAYLQDIFGWRGIYLFLSGLTLVCALIVWVIVRDNRDSAAVRASLTAQRIRLSLKAVFWRREVWLLGGWVFCQAGVYFALIGLWAGQYLQNAQGLDAMEAGSILTLPACSLVAAPLMTWAAERVGSARKVVIALACGTLILSVPLMYGLPKLSSLALSAYFICLSICAISGTALVFSMAKALFPVELAGTVSGFINIFPFAGAAVVQHSIGKALALGLNTGMAVPDAYSRSFVVISATAMLACVLSMFIRSEKM